MTADFAHVLVIDGDPAVRQALTAALSARGYAVEAAAGSEEGMDSIKRERPDVVILDLMVPAGLDLIRAVRSWSSVPMLVLSYQSDEETKVAALDLGADDYIIRPCGMGELVARIRVALRHAATTNAVTPVFQAGDLAIDLERRRVTVAGREVLMSPIEYTMLKVLAQQAGRVITHNALLREVWGPTYGTEYNYVHVYIRRLRRKIETDPTKPHYLITEPGAGYRIHVD